MTRRGLATALAGLLGAGALGCGDDSALLSRTDADGLKDTLAQVRSAVDARDCSAASAQLRELRSEVGNLSGSVDRELRVRLREEIVGTLAPAVESECDEPTNEVQPTVTEEAPPAPTPEPEPTPTETDTPTETTPPPTDTSGTVPAPEAPEVPVPEPTPEDPGADPGGFGEEPG